uniref:Uncharacterized protein n=1 Tax=Solanum tuberosum TaxID=4113 RepID=M1D8S1_SOLTU
MNPLTDHRRDHDPSGGSWFLASVYWFWNSQLWSTSRTVCRTTDYEGHRGSLLGLGGLLAQDDRPIHCPSSRPRPVMGYMVQRLSLGVSSSLLRAIPRLMWGSTACGEAPGPPKFSSSTLFLLFSLSLIFLRCYNVPTNLVT